DPHQPETFFTEMFPEIQRSKTVRGNVEFLCKRLEQLNCIIPAEADVPGETGFQGKFAQRKSCPMRHERFDSINKFLGRVHATDPRSSTRSAVHLAGFSPTRPSAIARKSSPRRFIRASTSWQSRCHSCVEAPAGQGGEHTSTYALAFGSVPLGRREIRA